MKKRSLLAAYGTGNFVIGIKQQDGSHKMPDWNLLGDRLSFEAVSRKAGIVIMGRSTYLSLPKKYRPLPGRKTIILTRNPLWSPEEDSDNVFIAHSLFEALAQAEALGDEVCIAGGSEIYAEALKNVIIHELYLTCVHGTFDGNVLFPIESFSLIHDQYEIFDTKEFSADEKNSHPFTITSLRRKAS